jgi:hypothetical protein
MKRAQFYMSKEQAPPGFWHWRDDVALVDGVELQSRVPTRFFQSVDPYPQHWGQLIWRVQLNKIVSDRANLPLFRSFYPGVEWNLNHFDFRWFLTAWFRWKQRGSESGEPFSASQPRVEGDTVLFPIAPPDPASDERPCLRSRVDARDRRSIARAVRSQDEQTVSQEPDVIVIDDLIDLHQAK